MTTDGQALFREVATIIWLADNRRFCHSLRMAKDYTKTAFGRWLILRNMPLKTASEKFGVGFGTIGKWARGEVTPHPLRCKEIERITRKAVMADSWEKA